MLNYVGAKFRSLFLFKNAKKEDHLNSVRLHPGNCWRHTVRNVNKEKMEYEPVGSGS